MDSSSSIKTFKSDDSKLFTINEYVVDFEELKEQGIDFRKMITTQKWGNYFDMLYGPVFHNLVKDFWLNASVHNLDKNDHEIRSVVMGTPIIITPSLIAHIIRCEEDGFDIEYYTSNSPFRKLFPKFLTEENGNPSRASSLVPLYKQWHQLIITNFLPRERDCDLLDENDKNLMVILSMTPSKINLPLMIFNYLKSKIMASREGKFFFIPFGKVLSELFLQKGIIKKVQKAGLIEALETSWGTKFLGPHKVETQRKRKFDNLSC